MSKKKKNLYFTANALRQNILAVSESENSIFMPNEIFDDLIEGFKDEKRAKSSTHIAYAYAYTFLAHYMYRYCKHLYYMKDSFEGKIINEKMLKQILCFPPDSDVYTYITKKGGVLENLGYIRKVSDIPIDVILANDEIKRILDCPIGKDYVQIEEIIKSASLSKGIFKIYKFIMKSSYEGLKENTKNSKFNYPVKGFEREIEMDDIDDFEENKTGTFWLVEKTHLIDINIFIYCMSDLQLGVKGFYMYCYLLYMNDRCVNGFDCSINGLVKLTGLGIRTVRDTLMILEERNMITNDHKPYCLDKKEWQQTKANTYKVLLYDEFILDSDEFNEIPKQRKISAKRYADEIGFIDNLECLEVEIDSTSKTKKKNKGFPKRHISPAIYNDSNQLIPLPF